MAQKKRLKKPRIIADIDKVTPLTFYQRHIKSINPTDYKTVFYDPNKGNGIMIFWMRDGARIEYAHVSKEIHQKFLDGMGYESWDAAQLGNSYSQEDENLEKDYEEIFTKKVNELNQRYAHLIK